MRNAPLLVIALLVTQPGRRPAGAAPEPAAAAAPRPAPSAHQAAWDTLGRMQATGRWAAAESLSTTLAATLEGEPGLDSLELSKALLYIASTRYQQRLVNDDIAARAIERSIAIRERNARPGDVLVEWSHHWATKFYADLGRHEDALRHARETLRLESAGARPDSLRLSDDHLSVALALHALGREDESRTSYLRAIGVCEAKTGTANPALVPVLAEYGQFLCDVGEFDEARALLQRARAIAEMITDPRSDRLEGVLARLTTLELRVGNIAESVELAQRSYELAAARVGEDALPTLNARTRLAYRLAEFGDDAASAARLRVILPLYAARLGANHPSVLNARLSRLQSSLAIGDTAGAGAELASLAPAVAAQASVASSNALYVPMLQAELRRLGGDNAGARAQLEAAIDAAWSRRRTLAARIAEAGLVELRTVRGPADRAAAQRMLARFDQLRDSTSVRATPEWIALLGERAAAEARVGLREAAWNDALAAAQAARERLRFQVQALSDRRSLQLAEQVARPCDVLARLARDGSPAQVAAAWDQVVRWRGLVRSEVSARRLAGSVAADTAVAAAHARWLAAQRRLAQSVVSGAAHPEDPESAARYEAGRREADEAERGFMRLLGGAPPDSVSLAHVLEHLAPGQALVAFVGSDVGAGDRSLGAFVAVAGVPAPRYVELGPEAAIATAIGDWTPRLGTPPPTSVAGALAAEHACREHGAVVRARVWEPLLRAAGPVTELLVVPEGVTWSVPWLALPGHAGGYVADESYTVRVLNAEREVLPQAPRTGRGLLAVGGPDFDSAGADRVSPAGKPSALGSRAWPCAAGRAEPLAPLPAAREEAEAIAALWRDSPRGGAEELLVGAQPDERTFKREAPGKAVIHLATHGIVLRDTCAAEGALSLRGVGGVADLAARPARAAAAARGWHGRSAPPVAAAHAPRSTWLGRRVWLALAGANAPVERAVDENEGLLTAEEVATLELDGTDWVVLSACHSGVGQAWGGEGELGMRRAFHLAGAHAVIASRWAVADEPTREWMLALYAARLRGLSAGAAVRAASRAALAARRLDGRSTHPFYWAGFEATGD
jgi:hypothetical protein